MHKNSQAGNARAVKGCSRGSSRHQHSAGAVVGCSSGWGNVVQVSAVAGKQGGIGWRSLVIVQVAKPEGKVATEMSAAMD